MRYKVNIDYNKINRDMSDRSRKAKLVLKNEIVKDTRKYVPLKTATLVNSANHSINSNDDLVVYQGPYAKFLYYGKVMLGKVSRKAWANKGETKEVTNKKLTYQRGGSNWFEKSKEVNGKKWLEMVKKIYE